MRSWRGTPSTTPTYGVFDEARVFAPGHDLAVVRVRGVDVALAICEDIWQEGGPVSMAREAGAELLLVLNGSPYEREKDDTRLELAARRAGQAACALAYLNLVGGRTSSSSMATRSSSTLTARCWPADRSSSRTSWSSTSTSQSPPSTPPT